MLPEIESYKCAAISTAHISKSDRDHLEELAGRDSMVMSREFGFFIKLYENDDGENDNYRDCMSTEFNMMVSYLYSQGYRMIELDCDAPTYPQLFTTFSW